MQEGFQNRLTTDYTDHTDMKTAYQPTTLSVCVKIPTPSHIRVLAPANCSGALSDCLARDPKLTEERWHRGQMRSWAGLWRESRLIAARLGRPAAEVAETYLSLAKIYRDGSFRSAGRMPAALC